MKTNKRITIFCLGAMLLAALAGCSKDLNIEQNGALSQNDYYQTDEEIESAISTVYSFWRSWYTSRVDMLDTFSDDISKGGINVNWFGDWKLRNIYTYNSGNEGLETYYKDCYIQIYYCNLVLDKATGNSDIQKRCIAEAKFFRAFSYFELAALWGETVPVVDHLLTSDEYHVTRSQPGELWALVEQDLKDAISVLPAKKALNDPTANRVTKGAAQTVLGKAYLWQKKYQEAADAFEAVIGSGLYDLWDGDYDLLLHVEANYCCEKVLDAIVPNDQANVSTNSINRAIGRWGYQGFATSLMSLSPEAKSKFYSGDNYFPPRKGLYDAFLAEEGENGYRFKSTLRTVWELQDEGCTVTTDMPDHDLYFNWKNRPLQSDRMSTGVSSTSNQYINLPFIRYAEVLLLAAEAQLRAGNQAKADTYLNKVRTRAKLPFKTATLDAIKLEKRLELCFEGTRYMDLVRWQNNDGTHDAYNALKEQGQVEYHLKVTKNADGTYTYERAETSRTPEAGFKENKHEWLPIPQTEIEVNGKYVTQNPGW